MSLLAGLTIETGDAAQAEFLSQVPRLNLFATMAHAPSLARAVALLGGEILYKGSLDPRTRETAILKVGHLAGCAYEVAQHERIGRAVGISEDRIEALKKGSDEVFEGEELLAIRWAEEVAAQGSASEGLVNATLEALGPARTVELAIVVGYYWMLASFLKSFRIMIEADDEEGGIDLSRRPAQL